MKRLLPRLFCGLSVLGWVLFLAGCPFVAGVVFGGATCVGLYGIVTECEEMRR